MTSIAKALFFIAMVLVGTGVDIYAARIGAPGAGLHIGVAFVALAALSYVTVYRKVIDLRYAYLVGLLFFALIGWSLFSTMQAADTALGLITITRYLVIFATAAILIGMAGSERDINDVLIAGVHWSIYILVATIAFDLIQPGTFSKQLTRPAGLPENPNGASQALAMLFTMLILLERGRGLNRKFILAGALVAMGMLATLSRGGVIMMMVLTASTLFFKAPKSRNIVLPITAVILVGAAIFVFQAMDSAAYVQNQTTLNRMQRLTDLSYYTDTSDSRYRLVQMYFASASPIFGAGPGASSIVEDFGGATHNTFIKLYWETGMIACVLYVAMILAPLAWSRSWEVVVAVLILGLLSVLTNYNMDNRLFVTTVFLAYLVARRHHLDRLVSGK